MKHLLYLRYLLRHKWYVAVACFEHGLYWRGIVHDWSKFLPSEWRAYAEMFYGGPKKPTSDPTTLHGALELVAWEGEARSHRVRWQYGFDRAWLRHQHRQPHHWQHWVLREDSGATKVLPMPREDALEMYCDWVGAGRAITGSKSPRQWYEKNKERIMLHILTREFVESLMPPT